MIPLLLASTAGYGYMRQQKMKNDETLPERDMVDEMNNRSDLLFNMKRTWDRALELGAQPWGPGRTAQGPTTVEWYQKGPPHLAEIAEWDQPMDYGILHGQSYQKAYQDNYSTAYSTELSAAVMGQLVDGMWHETVTKGPVLQQIVVAGGEQDPSGFNLYEWAR